MKERDLNHKWYDNEVVVIILAFIGLVAVVWGNILIHGGTERW